MIKHLPDTANIHLLSLFNRIWSEGALIPTWKESLVIPLPKVEADKSKPESYRPIALTSVMCKLFERLIVNRLEWFLEGSSSINPLQSGFRKQRCTIDHVVRLQDDIHKSLHNKENTLAVFLDFSKAFDMVWSQGLLNEISLHGVNGRMLRWISDFLTGRTIRVAVGGNISNCFEMQNGTPQGSILSPILFNIMINDLPTPVDMMTRSSIFADDSAAWRSGRNVSFLNRKIQTQLDAVVDWSDRWGFKLSETKTIAVLFGSHHKLTDVKLSIKGVPVPVQTEAKFLGVTFDHRLSWKPHIDNLITRCKRVTNLMKSLTGSHWGASKTGLLSVYRSLTRSKLDYGCQAYYAASSTQLTRLDRIQSQCLRICCGAFITTPINALQQDCGEMPLSLRRERFVLRFALKVSASPSNPARIVTEDSWKVHYGRPYETGKEPIYTILSKFKEAHPDVQPTLPTRITTPPWRTRPVEIDTTLTRRICKKTDTAAVMQAEALALIHQYAGALHIYTDGSRTEDGRVAAAFYVEDLEYGHTKRLQDNSSVYAAELAGIGMAIDWIERASVSTKIVIFSDSLSAMQSLRSSGTSVRPNTIAALLARIAALDVSLQFVWVPSHVGIRGNDAADELARTGTRRQAVEIHPEQELSEEFAKAD